MLYSEVISWILGVLTLPCILLVSRSIVLPVLSYTLCTGFPLYWAHLLRCPIKPKRKKKNPKIMGPKTMLIKPECTY
jgi:hypothetical protein